MLAVWLTVWVALLLSATTTPAHAYVPECGDLDNGGVRQPICLANSESTAQAGGVLLPMPSWCEFDNPVISALPVDDLDEKMGEPSMFECDVRFSRVFSGPSRPTLPECLRRQFDHHRCPRPVPCR